MKQRSIGFIGGGRVVRLLLAGLRRSGSFPADCVVSDAKPDVLEALAKKCPGIRAVGADNAEAARQDLVFGALHPPVLADALPEIGRSLRPGAIFVSLSPRPRLADLTRALGGFERVARLIPNAPSIVGKGYNPVAFSGALSAAERAELRDWLSALGECPEVSDEQLEAYAVLTAMGPTYFWFQFEELVRLGGRFGLAPQAVERALPHMLHGAVDAFFASNLPPAEVIDLVPVKPLEASEESVREAYRSTLTALHGRLTGK